MPTKRRPLKHAPRIGEVRVTARMLSLYCALQDEIRAHGRGTFRVGRLRSELHIVMRQLPWEDGDVHDLHYHQLHLLAYPDPETRPKRLDANAHNPLIADYEREHP